LGSVFGPILTGSNKIACRGSIPSSCQFAPHVIVPLVASRIAPG
jgi:hypothetical protein